MAKTTGARAGWPVHGLLLLSGFAGLGYQIVWTRMLSIGLGHEVLAVLAVVAAFFAGLAIGAVALDARVARSRRPGLWYAGLEVAIGVWTVALIWLIPRANAEIAALMGPDPSELRRWAVAFAAPAILLLPATVAMGATLPAAERLYARLRRDGRGIGGLYAANAAGAMAGALLTAVWLAPALGYSATLGVFAAVNLICAVVAVAGPARGEAIRAPLPPTEAGQGPTAGLLVALALTGCLGIGFEVAVVRALSQILENTVYSFAAALAVYLLATALGAGAYQRLYAARRGPGWDRPALGVLAPLTALACAGGALAVFAVPQAYPWLRGVFGETVAGAIGAEIACAALVLALPAAAMGALFSHLAQGARGPGGGLGAAFAANTLGAAVAPLFVGVVAVPAIGVVASMAALGAAYLALTLVARPGLTGTALGATALGVAAFLAIGPVERRLVPVPPGGGLVAHREGVAATASVITDPAGARWLLVNGTQTMGGDATLKLDRIQGHAALLRHPAPERALFLGVGTGATLAAAAAYPGLRAEGVELLPEALELIPEFRASWSTLRPASPRIGLSVADARRYVRAPGPAYDVIVADNYHPAKDGTGLLYTVEHFEAVRARLAPGGLFMQWLPLHQLDLPTLRLVLRSFLAVFPDARLSMGNTNLATPLLALTASEDGRLPRLERIRARDYSERLRRELAAIDYASPFALFGGFMAGPEALAAFAGSGPLNTDDHPIVLFEAPRTVYAPLGPAIDRLLALTEAFSPTAEEAVAAGALVDGRIFAARLEAYWRARDAFLALGAERALRGNLSADARELVPAFLEILAISPDFEPAWRPVLAMAAGLAETERAFSVAILDRLLAIHPRLTPALRLRERIASATGIRELP